MTSCGYLPADNKLLYNLGTQARSNRAANRRKIMQVFVWAVCGLAAGWFTGRISLSMGRDQLINLLLGVAGGAAGGFLLDAAFFNMEGSMIYTSLAAIFGATLLVLLSRYLRVSREWASTFNNAIFYMRPARVRAARKKRVF